MIDTSRSTTDNPTVGALIVAGAQHFVGNMWSGDRARVGSFNHLIKINPSRFVDDPHWLNSSLARLHYQYPPDEGTMLYDAMLESIDALVNVDGRPGQRGADRRAGLRERPRDGATCASGPLPRT